MLNDEERPELLRWRRRRSGRSGLYVRAGIVLDCAAGLSGALIAERYQTLTKWRRWFASGHWPVGPMRSEPASRASMATNRCRRFWTSR